MDDQDISAASKRGWLQETMEQRSQCYHYFQRCQVPQIDSHNAIDPPNEVVALHSSITNYASGIRAVRHDLDPNHFTKTLTHVTVPISKTYGPIQTNLHGELKDDALHDAIEYTQWPVSLDELNDTWSTDNKIHVEIEIYGQRDTIPLDFDVYLPVAASKMVLDELDDCLYELGWTPHDVKSDMPSYGYREAEAQAE